MKVYEIIAKANEIKPNTYSDEDKLSWLAELEQIIVEDIVMQHDNPKGIELTDTTPESELIGSKRFADMYIAWIFSKIDFYNGDTQRYNNDIILYNTVFETFKSYWRRHHMPLLKGVI